MLKKDRRMKIMLFLVNLILVFFVCGIYILYKHFACDDYTGMYKQYDTAKTVMSQSYRNILGVIYYILDKFGINIVIYQRFFGTIFLISIVWCITQITEIFCSLIEKKDKIIVFTINMASILFFVNAFLSEWFWFTQAYIQWTIGILGIVAGVKFIGIGKMNYKKWLMGTFFLFLAAGSYQICLAQFVYIIMCIIYIRYKRINKQSILHMIYAAVSVVLSVVSNILVTKILYMMGYLYKGDRVKFELNNIRILLKDILIAQKQIWIDSQGILPRYILLIFLLFLVIMAFLSLKNKLREGMLLILVLISGMLVVYLTQMLQQTVWLAIRVTIPIFSIYSVLIWVFVFNIVEQNKENGKANKVVNIVVIMFCILNFVVLQREAVDMYITNALDKSYILQIDDYITRYEQKNGLTVTKVAFIHDQYLTYDYTDEIHSVPRGELQSRAFVTDWSNDLALNYYSHRNLEKVSAPQSMIDYFSDKNWNSINISEQVMFKDDTVYICVY